MISTEAATPTVRAAAAAAAGESSARIAFEWTMNSVLHKSPPRSWLGLRLRLSKYKFTKSADEASFLANALCKMHWQAVNQHFNESSESFISVSHPCMEINTGPLMNVNSRT